MPVNWDKKSFSLPTRSGDADSVDLEKRWNDTFPKHAPTGITYPVFCSKCAEVSVNARDHHWALGGKVQCGKCGPFGSSE